MEMTKEQYNELRAELVKRGITLEQIAKQFYVTRQHVRQVLSGKHESDKAWEIRNYVRSILDS